MGKLKQIKAMFPPKRVLVQMGWINEMSNLNQFYFWYERILESKLKTPKTKYYVFSYDECYKYLDFLYQEGTEEERSQQRHEIWLILKDKLIDSFLQEFNKDGKIKKVFLKNGAFSNKFNFEDCTLSLSDLNEKTFMEKFERINFESLMHETGGHLSFVIREFIEPKVSFGNIYNGMPLRSEFRVFYDFNLKKVLYVVDYWNFDYCFPHIRDEHDQKVFLETKEELQKRFEQLKDKISNIVEEHVQNIYVRSFEGVWSIDMLLNSEDLENDLYLIDMAIGSRSAYYNHDLVIEKQREIEDISRKNHVNKIKEEKLR